MKLRLVRIERDRRGPELKRLEEILQTESDKAVTRESARRLIARDYPEFAPFRGALLPASEENNIAGTCKRRSAAPTDGSTCMPIR